MSSKSSAAELTLIEELNQIFGNEGSNINRSVETLQRQAWAGKMSSQMLRPLCWRLLLGVIPLDCNMSKWKSHIQNRVQDYAAIREREYPQMDRVSADPLSAYSEDKESEEWKKYYKDVELCSFINVDLDRLYLHGIEDEYFQTKERREILNTVLFVWAARNSRISYRQGMHEIVGPILFCLEREIDAWTAGSIPESHPLYECFTRNDLEANTYWIFERIMGELEILYDPNPPVTKGPEALPIIVSFCAKVQEHFLRDLDPELCTHLEESFVQSQLYGMRWCRLLFGREIEFTTTRCFRVWDYLFACCAITPNNFYSYLPNRKFAYAKTTDSVTDDPMGTNRKFFTPELEAMIAKKGEYSPLIASVADVMLAMLLQIRGELVEGDSNTVMMLVMHYPEVVDVTPILDLADMIRRGVLRTGAHMGKDLSVGDNLGYQFQSNSRTVRQPPAWLNNLRPSSIANNVNSMKQKVVERFGSRNSTNGSALNNTQDWNEPEEDRIVSSQQHKGSPQTSATANASLLDYDDPLSALLAPATSFVADASANISLLASLSFPYLSSTTPSAGEEMKPTTSKEVAFHKDLPVTENFGHKARGMQTPTPMTKSKGLTPVTGDAKIKRPENWSGGVDLPTLTKTLMFGDDADGNPSVHDIHERCAMVSQRLSALAHSLQSKDAHGNVASQSMSSDQVANLCRQMLGLASFLDGSLSWFQFDSSMEDAANTSEAHTTFSMQANIVPPEKKEAEKASSNAAATSPDPAEIPPVSRGNPSKPSSATASLLESLISTSTSSTNTKSDSFMTSFGEERVKSSRDTANLFL